MVATFASLTSASSSRNARSASSIVVCGIDSSAAIRLTTSCCTSLGRCLSTDAALSTSTCASRAARLCACSLPSRLASVSGSIRLSTRNGLGASISFASRSSAFSCPSTRLAILRITRAPDVIGIAFFWWISWNSANTASACSREIDSIVSMQSDSARTLRSSRKCNTLAAFSSPSESSRVTAFSVPRSVACIFVIPRRKRSRT